MLLDLFKELIAGSIDCDVLYASSLHEARQVLEHQPVNLLVADINLPDGNGLSLLPELYHRYPTASALVVTGHPSMESAISAFRGGAVDFVAKPFSADQLVQHIRGALDHQQYRQRREQRLTRLRGTLRRLNAARKMVNKKVDLLCNDLINAYTDLSKQFDQVRIQDGFRQFINSARDLEQLLCHTMDWLLRQVGYCNIGIWLTSAETDLQLGAYMKYTIPADPQLTEALQRNLLRQAIRRGFVRLREPDLQAALTPPELKHLAGQDIIAVNTSYLGESLGTLLLFRDHKTPFSNDDVAAIKSICPLFALSLTRAVHQMEEKDEPPQKPSKSRKKHDPADWWKTGEEPSF
jgi:FixJ family two-component response regulator